VKSYYDLLGVRPEASAEDIKRAFRHEISRYHPDKVQHLGQEFQDLAASRAADLTRAYRVLTDTASRAQYDRDLLSVPAAAPPPAGPAPPAAEPPGEPAQPPGARAPRASDQLVRRAALARFRKALERSLGEVESISLSGFDVSVLQRSRRSLFRKGEADLRLLARFVPVVDAAAIDETWRLARRGVSSSDVPVCLFLLGVGLADKAELARAVDANRRHRSGRATSLLLVPVDVRTWDALIPTGAPAPVRALIEQLRNVES
jgi:curved DNA-binding protein CbpA